MVLSLRGVSKAFGAVQAVRDVSFDCREGEIHCLVGENGSGKSTLLGVASGFLSPDGGEVEIGGRRRRRGSPAEARRFGLGIAYQTYSHVLPLSVAENLYLAVPNAERPAHRRLEKWATSTLDEYGLDVPVTAPVGSLSLAQRQLLEVVKSLLAKPKVLLLDEPTTALGPQEVEQLHTLVRERSRTGVGIVYVSHRIPEVLGIADRISVLRDGVKQGTFDAAGMISTTGRRPVTAEPNAAPARASSEIGVSNTRSSPYFSKRPGVVAKTPPAAAMSSPKRITRSSAASSSSSASRIAVRKGIAAISGLRPSGRAGAREAREDARGSARRRLRRRRDGRR